MYKKISINYFLLRWKFWWIWPGVDFTGVHDSGGGWTSGWSTGPGGFDNYGREDCDSGGGGCDSGGGGCDYSGGGGDSGGGGGEY